MARLLMHSPRRLHLRRLARPADLAYRKPVGAVNVEAPEECGSTTAPKPRTSLIQMGRAIGERCAG